MIRRLTSGPNPASRVRLYIVTRSLSPSTRSP